MQFRPNLHIAILGLAASVNALGNNWTLSCGGSCDDLTAIASGDYSSGTQTCENFPASYEYCYLDEADTVTYGDLYVYIDEAADCGGVEGEQTTFNAGVCTSVAGYESYIVVLEI